MAQLRVDVDGFNLNSTWTCWSDFFSDGYGTGQTPATEATQTVTFTYKLPALSKIVSAKVHSTWKGTLCGFSVATVDGKERDADGFVDIDGVDPSATSLSVDFLFVAERDEMCAEMGLGDRVENNHTSSAIISEVYLLIEYEENDGGYIYHAEDGVLVPYNFYRAEGGVLVPYNLFGIPGAYDPDTQSLLTANGEQFLTSLSEQFKVTGGMS